MHDSPSNPAPDSNPAAAMKRFAGLWVRSQTTVASYVYAAVRDTHEAEDVLQVIAEAAVEAFDSYDPDRSFTGWVLGIARHRVLHHNRTRGRDRHVFGEKALSLIADAHAELDEEQDDRRAALKVCMGELTERSRELIDLRYRADLKPADIAERVGMTPGALNVALHRVRQSLADCIRRRLGEDVGAKSPEVRDA